MWCSLKNRGFIIIRDYPYYDISISTFSNKGDVSGCNFLRITIPTESLPLNMGVKVFSPSCESKISAENLSKYFLSSVSRKVFRSG